MKWVYDDGGRRAAGFKGDADDCSCRSIAIASGRPYAEVYRDMNEFSKEAERHRRGKRALAVATGRGSSARTGVFRDTLRDYLHARGWAWTPTMQIGQGCKVHLREEELPKGRLIVAVSKHTTAVIDRVIHDTHDPSREGTRCVYGYWRRP